MCSVLPCPPPPSRVAAGMKVLDCGCGVGGPMRTIASVSGAHVTGKQHTCKTPLLNIDLCSSCLGGKEMGGSIKVVAVMWVAPCALPHHSA